MIHCLNSQQCSLIIELCSHACVGLVRCLTNTKILTKPRHANMLCGDPHAWGLIIEIYNVGLVHRWTNPDPNEKVYLYRGALALKPGQDARGVELYPAGFSLFSSCQHACTDRSPVGSSYPKLSQSFCTTSPLLVFLFIEMYK